MIYGCSVCPGADGRHALPAVAVLFPIKNLLWRNAQSLRKKIFEELHCKDKCSKVPAGTLLVAGLAGFCNSRKRTPVCHGVPRVDKAHGCVLMSVWHAIERAAEAALCCDNINI